MHNIVFDPEVAGASWFPATGAAVILDVAHAGDIKDLHAEGHPLDHHHHRRQRLGV